MDAELRSGEKLGQHVEKATEMQRVVPTAIVMAKAGKSVREAQTFLYQEPILRKALLKIESESTGVP